LLDKTDEIISLGGNDTNQKKKLLPLTSDVIFKAVFSRPGNEDILKSLLEAILDIYIKEVQVQNTELPVDSFDNKAGVMDIKVRIDEDIICDIEMQVKNVWNIDHRSTYYISKNLSSEMRRGDDYKAVKKSIGINLLAFEFYKRNSYRSIAHMKFEKTKKEEYIDMGYTDEDEIATTDLEMHFIELPKFIKKAPEPKTKLEQWLYFIAGREEKMKDIEERVKEIEKAEKVLEELSADKEAWNLYEARDRAMRDYNSGMRYAKEQGWNEGMESGIKRGEQIGLKKGIQKSKIEIAKKMIEKGIPIENICEITNLTKEEIEKITK